MRIVNLAHFPYISSGSDTSQLSEKLSEIYDTRKTDLLSLDIQGRLQYCEDDEKAVLMGNIQTLYGIYILTILACAIFIKVGYKLYRTPREVLHFCEVFQRDGYEALDLNTVMSVRIV